MINVLIFNLLCGVFLTNVNYISDENRCLDQKDIKSILALGDSYTIGESVSESERWPVQLQKAISAENNQEIDLKIIATTGWRTDDLRNAVEEETLLEKYDLVTLLIGVNNQYQNKPMEEYPLEFEKCLQQAIGFARNVEDVIVVSIPDYAYTPFGQKKSPDKISKELDEYNATNKEISKKYGVNYVYITDITRRGLEEPGLVANDGLHPSGTCYKEFIPKIMNAINGE